MYKNPSNTLLYLNTLPPFPLSSPGVRPNAAASMASEGGRELLLVGKEMDAGGRDSRDVERLVMSRASSSSEGISSAIARGAG